MPPIPQNKKLYETVKKEAKKRFRVWPSAYASGWLVKEYKRRGGTYGPAGSRNSSSLGRWYKEKWVDVCHWPKKVSCGRKTSSWKSYPYCRPSVRVNKKTPRTVQELTSSQRRKRCSQKRKNPKRRVTKARK
jgi:hypothetical protein